MNKPKPNLESIMTPANDPSAVALEIARRMVLKNMDIPELSEISGMKRTYIYDILGGRSHNPRLDNLRRIARALDCTLEDLTNPSSGQGDTQQSRYALDAAGILPLRPTEHALIELWRALSPKDRDAFFARIVTAVTNHMADLAKRSSESADTSDD